MKCKKSLMGLAALLIVIFHFYMPLTSSILEMTIYKAAYIGVDIFFFISAYSLSKRDLLDYKAFIRNRFAAIYLPFVVLAVFAFTINGWGKNWSLLRFVEVILGIEFFKRGGGAFLWYLVAIMLLYLLVPFMVRLKEAHGYKAFAGFFLAWLILVVFLQFLVKYDTIYILINRLPIFFIGLYYDEIKEFLPKKLRPVLIILGLTIGFGLIYRYAATVRLMKPVTDSYYVIAVVFVLSLVGLFDYISARTHIRNLPLQFLGSISLELYGLQMILGYKIETSIFKYLKGVMGDDMLEVCKLITFLLLVIILTALAYLFSLAKRKIMGIYNGMKEDKKK